MANGWFNFVNGQTLPASRVQDYLMNQSVMVFADSTARDAALTVPTEGMVTYLIGGVLEYFDGLNWLPVSTPPEPVVIPDPLSPLLLIGA